MEITDKEVFEIAINAEIRAKEAYEKLASLTKSDIIRDELLFLAKEEDKHREIISKMAEKFEGERTEPKKINIDVMGEFRVIAEKMAEAIKKPDVNVDEVYEIAMQAELVSEKLYNELAGYAATEKTKLVLEMLADMERNHYNILRKQYDYITRYPEIYKEEFYDQLMKDINFNF
ncbi:ferritin-like domain-containing protein [Thermococcus thioreducens]|uniref:Rubrerythrin n=1 Tax=Thermococcus thioreducens TaxID=277988 RepID=A0A0Q2XLI9_9EURY|nr:ferritin family protein [Thermococcus thioreducens]ASJ12723.1 rubrerythrin [Thermococcus thioreducens]KQH82052.1 rubrerythrin [Thermococcus thioreducens]SEV86211.1 Rubrerythrin [Thermococcus thioreducens]